MNQVRNRARAGQSCIASRFFKLVAFNLLAWICVPTTVFAGIEIEQLDTGIYYGAFPKTDSDYVKLRSCGIRHVIDMRSFRKLSGKIERRRVEARGMVYERLPIGFYPTSNDTTAKLMERIVTQPCGPIYFHCTLGSDRTGLIVALYRVHQMNWSPCCAYNEWKRDQFNPRLEDLDRYFWRSVGGHLPSTSSPPLMRSSCCPPREVNAPRDVNALQPVSVMGGGS